MADSDTNSAIATDALTTGIPLYVGRQAIFDRELKVVAYELLYRSGSRNAADVVNGEQATAAVLTNTFMEIGADVVTLGKPVFVNLTRDLLLDDVARLFPPNRVSVEILEDTVVDDVLFKRISDLRDSGYRIVLDDFIMKDEVRRLLPLADVIKLDVLSMSREALVDCVRKLAAYPAQLLAEKVETREELEFYLELGFDLFQGFVLEKPVIIEGERPPESRMALFELLARVNNPDIGVDELDEAVSRDVGIAWRLMRYINSAAFSLQAKVDSIRHAILLIGRSQIRSWVNLVVLAGLVGKSSDLLNVALLRAAMCDAVARRQGLEKPESYFTAGLFSVLDAMMRQPMALLVERLPLCGDIEDALLRREGPVGEVLATVIDYQHSRWDQVATSRFDPDLLYAAWKTAVEWSARFLAVDEG